MGEESTKKKSPVASALAVGHVGVCVGVMEVAVQCKNHTSEVWVEKKAHSTGRLARAHAFHSFKYRRCFACFAIQCFLALRVIESQFAGLARCYLLGKV